MKLWNNGFVDLFIKMLLIIKIGIVGSQLLNISFKYSEGINI